MAGIYIHIPFCKKACHYCNFHFSTSLQLKEKMVAAIIKEISLLDTNNDIISTIYFGGGTPSILTKAELNLIFDALKSTFSFSSNIEITLEANPDDISNKILTDWQMLGINRLSVGLQSFLEDDLKWMNRTHSATQSLICIDNIIAAGFKNFSIDLIYGSPLLSNDNWKKNIDIVTKKNIPHISCYALTVEPNTALQKMIALQKKENINIDKQAQQFTALINWMAQAGYIHYEISNFAKPNFKSKHNSSYWNGAKYYGIGPSAHSFDGIKTRQWNVSNNVQYITALNNNTIPFQKEVLSPTQQINEYIMTSLRTMEGMDINYITTKFGEKTGKIIFNESNKWLATNKLKQVNNNLILTNNGKLFADGIASDLFLVEKK